MVAECCPLLCSSDKDRLAPQVSSVRGSQARGQGRCMNKPAYKHLIITQAEEALWIKVSLFICFPFLLFGSLADFSLSLFLSCSVSLVCLPPPPSFSSSQSEHNMDSFGCGPHCLHHRAARGLSGSSICLLCVCGSPCLPLLVSLSVCGTPRLSESVFCVFGPVSFCRAVCLPMHTYTQKYMHW